MYVGAAQSEGRRAARNRSSRMRGGIDQLLHGCRDCTGTGRDNTSMIVVPDHTMNAGSVDSLSDSTNSTTVYDS